MQLVYSTAPADWEMYVICKHIFDNIFKPAYAHFLCVCKQLNSFKYSFNYISFANT